MNCYIDTDHYAIQQNNVGVNCFMAIGDVDGALLCFRQALAAKLASELSVLEATEANGEETLHKHDSHAPEIPSVADEESQQRCVTPEPADFRRSDQLEVYASGATEFVPYLYLTPFAIKSQDTSEIRNVLPQKSTPDIANTANPDDVLLASTESTIFSLMIMFNLALAHHMKDRASKKAYSIYQLAITVLSALPPPSNSQSLLLHVAILNNYGVWCLENHESSFMVMCFEEIMHILDETYCGDNDITLTLSVGVKRGIYHNLKAALNDCYVNHQL